MIDLSSPTLRDRLLGWLPLVTAIPIPASISSAEMARLPLAWLLAGLGESPVQLGANPGGPFVGVHNLLGVVALRGLIVPSACIESRFVSGVPRCVKSSGSTTTE